MIQKIVANQWQNARLFVVLRLHETEESRVARGHENARCLLVPTEASGGNTREATRNEGGERRDGKRVLDQSCRSGIVTEMSQEACDSFPNAPCVPGASSA